MADKNLEQAMHRRYFSAQSSHSVNSCSSLFQYALVALIIGFSFALAACSKQKAITSTTPVVVTPHLGSNGTIFLEGTIPMYPQVFVYDPKTQKIATPDGPEMSFAHYSVPVRVSSVNFGSFSGGDLCAVYKDVIFDLTNLQDSELLTFGWIATNGYEIQPIFLESRGHRNLLIDDNYTVFPDGSRSVSSKGPFVTLFVIATTGDARTGYQEIPSVRIFLRSDAGRQQTFYTKQDGAAEVELDRLKEATLVAFATGPNGQKIEVPIPLPIKGATKGLVSQKVYFRFISTR
jgi:hypothetical protein